MKRILVLLCTLSLLVNSWGFNNLFGTIGAEDVQAATTEGYDKVGLDDYGITDQAVHSNAGYTTLTPTTARSLHNMEFEGIVNIPTTAYNTDLLFGTEAHNAFNIRWIQNGEGVMIAKKTNYTDTPLVYLNTTGGVETGLSLFDTDLILNVKFTFATPDASVSDVTITVTLTEAADTAKTYNISVSCANVNTAELMNNIFTYTYPYGGTITLKNYEEPQEPQDPVKVGFMNYGIMTDTTYTALQYYKDILPGTATARSLHNMEFEGIINISAGRVILYFGEQYAESHLLDFYADGKMMIAQGDNPQLYVNFSEDYGIRSGFDLANNDLIVNVKFSFANPRAERTDITCTTTITDADDLTKNFSFSYTMANATTADKTNHLYVYTDAIGKITLKSMDSEWTVLDMEDFGITTGVGTAPKIGELEGSLDKVKIKATLNIPDSTGDVGPQFGNIFCFQRDAAGGNMLARTMGGTSSGYANLPGNAFNYNDYFGKDTEWEVAFWYTQGTDGDTDTVYLNMAYSINGSCVGQVCSLKEEHTSIIARKVVIPAGIGVVDGRTVLTVGGGDTNTTAFEVLVGQGDTLPTGHTSDGKYIIGWTADGSEVTTYDKAYTDYVAAFVDTKMLEVKQQNDGLTPKSVRFIGSLNNLTDYEEAGFVFANREVEGELTVDNGVRIRLNTAYAELNADGRPVTASETYDAYSNYFFAYAIRKIPAEAAIYARAYVVIDGTIIYGDMGKFVVSELQ